MTRNEFENLKVGDLCVFKRGIDRGKKCRVVYIEKEIEGSIAILVKAVDCEFGFAHTRSNTKLRLTGSHELDIC